MSNQTKSFVYREVTSHDIGAGLTAYAIIVSIPPSPVAANSLAMKEPYRLQLSIRLPIRNNSDSCLHPAILADQQTKVMGKLISAYWGEYVKPDGESGCRSLKQQYSDHSAATAIATAIENRDGAILALRNIVGRREQSICDVAMYRADQEAEAKRIAISRGLIPATE